MSREFDVGLALGSATQMVKLIDFSVSERNHTALVIAHWSLFDEYVPDPERMYNRGEVVRVGGSKYLLQNQGRIDLDKPPEINPLCKLFRDAGRYEWAREEYCLRGFERQYDGEWYRVTADRVDDSTPPPNSNSWERVD